MKRFLWFLSIGVFVAGLVYRFSGLADTSKAGAAGRTISMGLAAGDENGAFIESHAANPRLLSASVGGRSTFWHFTPADRAASDYVIYGRLAPRGTILDQGGVPVKAGRPGASRFDAALEARARLNGTAKAEGDRDLAAAKEEH